MINLLRRYRKRGLYLAAILIVPGSLIAVPILSWLDHQYALRKHVCGEFSVSRYPLLVTVRCFWRRMLGHPCPGQ